jgi:hypothetical protein
MPRGVEATDPTCGLSSTGAREPPIAAIDRGAPIGAVRPAAVTASTAERVALTTRAPAAASTAADQDTIPQRTCQRRTTTRDAAHVRGAATARSVAAIERGTAVGAAGVTRPAGRPAVRATEAAQRALPTGRAVHHPARSTGGCAISSLPRHVDLQDLPRRQARQGPRRLAAITARPPSDVTCW